MLLSLSFVFCVLFVSLSRPVKMSTEHSQWLWAEKKRRAVVRMRRRLGLPVEDPWEDDEDTIWVDHWIEGNRVRSRYVEEWTQQEAWYRNLEEVQQGLLSRCRTGALGPDRGLVSGGQAGQLPRLGGARALSPEPGLMQAGVDMVAGSAEAEEDWLREAVEAQQGAVGGARAGSLTGGPSASEVVVTDSNASHWVRMADDSWVKLPAPVAVAEVVVEPGTSNALVPEVERRRGFGARLVGGAGVVFGGGFPRTGCPPAGWPGGRGVRLPGRSIDKQPGGGKA